MMGNGCRCIGLIEWERCTGKPLSTMRMAGFPDVSVDSLGDSRNVVFVIVTSFYGFHWLHLSYYLFTSTFLYQGAS